MEVEEFNCEEISSVHVSWPCFVHCTHSVSNQVYEIFMNTSSVSVSVRYLQNIHAVHLNAYSRKFWIAINNNKHSSFRVFIKKKCDQSNFQL